LKTFPILFNHLSEKNSIRQQQNVEFSPFQYAAKVTFVTDSVDFVSEGTHVIHNKGKQK
jgi:hypothetical protein